MVNPDTEQAAVVAAAHSLNQLSAIIHANNVKAGWWTDLKLNGKLTEILDIVGPIEDTHKYNQLYDVLVKHVKRERETGTTLMLIVSEVAEAMEGDRKGLMDDKLPHRSMFEVELADVLIRVFDLAGRHKLDLTGAVLEKMAFNANRKDHKIENRLQDGGKAY